MITSYCKEFAFLYWDSARVANFVWKFVEKFRPTLEFNKFWTRANVWLKTAKASNCRWPRFKLRKLISIVDVIGRVLPLWMQLGDSSWDECWIFVIRFCLLWQSSENLVGLFFSLLNSWLCCYSRDKIKNQIDAVFFIFCTAFSF